MEESPNQNRLLSLLENKKILVAIGAIVLLLLAVIIIILISLGKKPAGTNLNKKLGLTPTQATSEKKTENQTTVKPTMSKTTMTLTPQPTRKKQTLIINNDQENSNVKIGYDVGKIGQDVLLWLKRIKGTNIIYKYGLKCQNNICTDLPTDNRVGITVVWALVKLYEQTYNDNTMMTINSEIGTYINEDQVHTIQNDFWNCKLMEDIWNSKAISDAAKINAMKICARGQYYPADLNEIDSFIEKNLNIDSLVLTAVNNHTLPNGIAADKTRFEEYASYASDFSAKYRIYKQTADKNRAQLFYLKAYYLYINNQTAYFDIDGILAIAALDIYKITNNSAYLIFSQTLATNKNPGSCSELIGCIYEAKLDSELYQSTNNQLFIDRHNALINTLIKQGYDDQRQLAFHTFGGTDISYLTRDNAIIAGLLFSIYEK